MRSNTAYLVLFLLAAVVGAATYFVLDALLGLRGVGNVLGYAALLPVGVFAALVVGAIARRWDWFVLLALGGLLLPAALRLGDDLTGAAISGALGSLGTAVLYGLLAAAGAVAGLMLRANRRTARRTRL